MHVDALLSLRLSLFGFSPLCFFLCCVFRVRTVEERRSLELEGYTTDVSKLRQKLRKLEQTLVSFKVAQLGDQNDPSIVSTSSASSNEATSPKGVRTQRGGAGGGGSRGDRVPPQRVQAKFALLDDDVVQLQQELTSLARKINST